MAPRRVLRATFLAAAKADIGRLAEDDTVLATLALRKVKELERGGADGVPLEEMALTGDLGDCRKLYFGLGRAPSHRIVYRDLGEDQGVEILEVVAVESRAELYAYLLAAARLGRLPIESRPRFNRLHQQVIQGRATRRGRRS